jgi:hypothetical protein
MSNVYQIWSEGWATTGQSSGATYHGTGTGNNFEEACKDFFVVRAWPKIDSYYHPGTNTYWGCNLFDNEADARKSFG